MTKRGSPLVSGASVLHDGSHLAGTGISAAGGTGDLGAVPADYRCDSHGCHMPLRTGLLEGAGRACTSQDRHTPIVPAAQDVDAGESQLPGQPQQLRTCLKK